MPRRVIILGSTGSIGTQTIDVVRHLNELHGEGARQQRIEVVGLSARNSVDLLAKQGAEFPRARIAMTTESESASTSALGGVAPSRVLCGPDAAARLVREVECDLVVAAIVGSAGLRATLAAVELGRDVALANKEALVAAGALIVPAAARSGSRLLPVDSEHSALWQCLRATGHTATGPTSKAHPPRDTDRGAPPMVCGQDVRRVILTASGGPFRTWTKAQIDRATPGEALKHPTWSMGAKVTIDSASLMNKALEIIEAHWLFGLPGEKIEAVIHPQSIVHAMAEFADGGVIAHMAPADMRIPIQHALTWPEMAEGAWPRMDWRSAGRLDFEPPDVERFPALGLAYEVMTPEASLTTAGAVLNAANEEAVKAFLEEKIPFGRISDLVRAAITHVPSAPIGSLADVQEAERRARAFVGGLISPC